MPRPSAASLHFPSIVRTGRLTAPADLNPAERAVFVGIVATVPADHFQASDLPLICAYARTILREREASENLAAQGVVSIDNKLSSWVAVQTQALKQVMSLARMLKLTPLARRSNPSRSGKPQQAMSYYDLMRLEQPGK